MIKKHRLALGFAITTVFLIGFNIFFFRSDLPGIEKACQLDIPSDVFLTNGEELMINDFQFSEWAVNISNENVLNFENGKILAVDKGKSQINFSKKDSVNCSFDVQVAVANITMTSGSQSLNREPAIKLNNTQVDGTISTSPGFGN